MHSLSFAATILLLTASAAFAKNTVAINQDSVRPTHTDRLLVDGSSVEEAMAMAKYNCERVVKQAGGIAVVSVKKLEVAKIPLMSVTEELNPPRYKVYYACAYSEPSKKDKDEAQKKIDAEKSKCASLIASAYQRAVTAKLNYHKACSDGGRSQVQCIMDAISDSLNPYGLNLEKMRNEDLAVNTVQYYHFERSRRSFHPEAEGPFIPGEPEFEKCIDEFSGNDNQLAKAELLYRERTPEKKVNGRAVVQSSGPKRVDAGATAASSARAGTMHSAQ